ncbi:hypothetical protein GCM10027162_04300 [Streptomyces incanus]
MVVVPHRPGGDPDGRGEFSDPHAPSRDVDVAAGSSAHGRANQARSPRGREEILPGGADRPLICMPDGGLPGTGQLITRKLSPGGSPWLK